MTRSNEPQTHDYTPFVQLFPRTIRGITLSARPAGNAFSPCLNKRACFLPTQLGMISSQVLYRSGLHLELLFKTLWIRSIAVTSQNQNGLTNVLVKNEQE